MRTCEGCKTGTRECQYQREWGCMCIDIEPSHSPIALLVGAGLIAAIMFGLPWILAAGEVAFK